MSQFPKPQQNHPSTIKANYPIPMSKASRMAITSTILGFLAILAACAVVADKPAFDKSRELSNRAVCAANIRGIGQSMSVYAMDNNDSYPIVSKTGGYGLASAGYATPNASADMLLSNSGLYSVQNPSITQNMWVLVLDGQVAAKQFVCKSDPAATTVAQMSIAGALQTNFNDAGKPSDFAYSYSFAYPWTTTTPTKIGGWWRDTTDASLPLMADIAPCGGTTTTDNPALNTANSFNHQRDGQNVGFSDSHAEFDRRPDAGQKGDNIFTFNAGTPSRTGTAFTGGKAPNIAAGGATDKWDICLVPVADANAKYTRK